MSFINTKNINPHLYLYALTFEPLKSSPDAQIKRLNLLAKTRRFDELLNVSQEVKDISFPTLSKKIQIAKQQTQKLKTELGQENVFETIAKIDGILKGQDPNFEEIDLQQDKIYKLAQILYEQGNYKKSLDILVLLEKQEIKEDLWLKTTWARLYNEILLGNNSLKTLQTLKKKIEDIEAEEIAFYNKEKKNTAVLMRKFYAQKEEFLLLSLFSLLTPGNATEENLQKLVEYCTLQKSYFSIVQLTFKELLRYLIIAIALNKTLHHNRSFDLFKLVEAINRKIVNYQDAFTQYISLIHIQYNFEEAKSRLEECRKQIKKDIFLAPIEAKIIEGLQFLYFKLACKVYQTIPLNQIATFTGKSSIQAQLWILAYIRSGDIQAKIDSINELVVNNRDRHHSTQKYVDVIPTLSIFVNSLSRAIANQ